MQTKNQNNQQEPKTNNLQIRNSIYASAVGDAWGNITEFNFSPDIKNPQLYPLHAFVTDDTQMALYALMGLKNSPNISTLDLNQEKDKTIVRREIGKQFLVWLKDPDNNRAPGQTCLNALNILNFKRNKTGLEGTQPHSKGCGANMRNPWFGLLPYTDQEIVELSYIQAEITHSHPLAYSASALTALAVKDIYTQNVILEKGKPNLFVSLVKTTEKLIANNCNSNPAVKEGLIMMQKFLTQRQEAYYRMISNDDEITDICDYLNAEGWVAEEALLLAVATADLHQYDLFRALERAVHTRGDSDSIACISGSIIGAGISTELDWLKEMSDRLEPRYLKELEESIYYLTDLK